MGRLGAITAKNHTTLPPKPIYFVHSRFAANSIGLCWDWREETGQNPPCGLEHKALTLLAIRLLTIPTLRLLTKFSHFYFCKLTRGYTLTSVNRPREYLPAEESRQVTSKRKEGKEVAAQPNRRQMGCLK